MQRLTQIAFVVKLQTSHEITHHRKTNFVQEKKINMLFAGLGSAPMVKNCDLGLDNAALGLRPRAAFSSPRSQFFTIRTFRAKWRLLFFFIKNCIIV